MCRALKSTCLEGTFPLETTSEKFTGKIVVPPELKAFECRMRELETLITASREKNMAHMVHDLNV